MKLILLFLKAKSFTTSNSGDVPTLGPDDFPDAMDGWVGLSILVAFGVVYGAMKLRDLWKKRKEEEIE